MAFPENDVTLTSNAAFQSGIAHIIALLETQRKKARPSFRWRMLALALIVIPFPLCYHRRQCLKN